MANGAPIIRSDSVIAQVQAAMAAAAFGGPAWAMQPIHPAIAPLPGVPQLPSGGLPLAAVMGGPASVANYLAANPTPSAFVPSSSSGPAGSLPPNTGRTLRANASSGIGPVQVSPSFPSSPSTLDDSIADVMQAHQKLEEMFESLTQPSSQSQLSPSTQVDGDIAPSRMASVFELSGQFNLGLSTSCRGDLTRPGAIALADITNPSGRTHRCS